MKVYKISLNYDLRKVSNPWREAIEDKKYELIKDEYGLFPILGGRLLKKKNFLMCFAAWSFQSLEGGY